MPAMTTPTPDSETPADLAIRLLGIMNRSPNGFRLEGSGCPLHDDGGPGPTPSYWAIADLRVAAYPEHPPHTPGEDDKAADKIRKAIRDHLVAQDLAAMRKVKRGKCTCLYESVNEDVAERNDGRDDRPQPESAYKLTARGREQAKKHWPPRGWAL
jgi:hypothetical protein